MSKEFQDKWVVHDMAKCRHCGTWHDRPECKIGRLHRMYCKQCGTLRVIMFPMSPKQQVKEFDDVLKNMRYKDSLEIMRYLMVYYNLAIEEQMI